MPVSAPRRTAWPFWAAAGYSAGLAVWTFGRWTSDPALLNRIIPWETVPAQLLVVLALVQFLRDCRPAGARGHAWKLLLVGFALNLAGSVMWVNGNPAGTFAYGLNDLFFGACVPVFALAAAMLFVDLGGSFRRPQVWLDAATLMLALGAMLWQLWVGPALAAGAPDGLRVMVTLGYSVGASAMLVFSVLAYMRITDWRRERSLALLFAGAIVSFLADLLWVDVGARGQLAAASLYQIAYCLGDLLLLAAIVLERQRAAPAITLERSVVSPTSSVPAFAVLVSIAVIAAERAHEGGLRATLPMVLAVVGAILVAVREVGARYELHRTAQRTARQEADRRLTELVRRSSDVIIVVGADRRLTYASPAAERVLGALPEQLIGSEAAELLGDANRSRVSGFVSALERGSHDPQETELDFEHPVTRRRVLHVVGSDEGATSVIGGIALTIRDVTDQRNAELELRALASRQHAAVSHELHEGLAQELAGISLLIRSLGRGSRVPADELAVLDSLPKQLSRAVDDARRLAASLSPLAAANGSLELAVRSLAQRIESSSPLEIHVVSRLGLKELPSVFSEEAYRIVTEALECAAMDLSSSRADIELLLSADALRIRIGWDAGTPVSGDAAPDVLRIIGHRARRLRGALIVEQSSDRRLQFVVDIPLRADPG